MRPTPDPTTPAPGATSTAPPPGTGSTEPPPTTDAPPPTRRPKVAVAADGQSWWQIAQANRDTLLTPEHRQRIELEGLGSHGQTVLALGELLALNRGAGPVRPGTEVVVGRA